MNKKSVNFSSATFSNTSLTVSRVTFLVQRCFMSVVLCVHVHEHTKKDSTQTVLKLSFYPIIEGSSTGNALVYLIIYIA